MRRTDGIALHIPADIVRALRLPTGDGEGELHRDPYKPPSGRLVLSWRAARLRLGRA